MFTLVAQYYWKYSLLHLACKRFSIVNEQLMCIKGHRIIVEKNRQLEIIKDIHAGTLTIIKSLLSDLTLFYSFESKTPVLLREKLISSHSKITINHLFRCFISYSGIRNNLNQTWCYDVIWWRHLTCFFGPFFRKFMGFVTSM